VRTSPDSDERRELVALVRQFVARDVVPAVPDFERDDIYPEPLLEMMGELGLFAVLVPEEYGGLGLDAVTFAELQMELSRGWMVLSGALTVASTCTAMLLQSGTEEQRRLMLPRIATGELRCATSLTEPDAGSDLQAIRMTARRDGDEFVVNGVKTWATQGRNAGLVMLLTKTDPKADPRHRGMTTFALEKEPGVASLPGLEISGNLPKLGYKGIEATELAFSDFRIPASAVLGGEAGIGQGFYQYMNGMEMGRLSVASSSAGIGMDALDRAVDYAKQRETFGKPIGQHQAIQLLLAETATRVEAARLLVLNAARKFDAGERADLEMGMAKFFASETAGVASMNAMRVLGGYGYSTEFSVERLYREAASLILGEGSNEIQQILIARRLLEQ
jgi:alkylation response protein AidB-like acyl-CoA dehydrogenase